MSRASRELSRSGDHFDAISGVDLTLSQHPRVDSGPSRIKLLRDAGESSVDERAFDRFAGVGEGSDFEQHFIAEPKLRPRNGQTPIDPLQGHVLSSGPDADRMTFNLQGTNYLYSINADSPLWSAMVLFVVLRVSYEP
jgi:hypothetical protein